LHLVGILFPHINNDARSKSHQTHCVVRVAPAKLVCDTDVSLQRIYIQGNSRPVDITAGLDFLGLCDQKSSYKHVSDFGRL